MKRFFSFLSTFVIFVSLGLAACGESVPVDIVDQNQGISRVNAQRSADLFLRELYPDGTVDTKFGKPIGIMMQSDSTISKSCRYGDGWASGEIRYERGDKVKVKCQTNGTGRGVYGCLLESDFLKKDYKGEEGSCQNLPELVKVK